MIELRSLRHLVVLARRLNYVRAADELGITQPTLSRSIQALEDRLGTRLFDRDRGGVHLTPQGQMLAERARFLLIDADEFERLARMNAEAQSGQIRFGMTPMPARALLKRVLASRLNQSPGVINEVIVRDVEELWGMLSMGEIEFFVSPDRPLHDLTHAKTELLGQFPLSLVVRAGHPLISGRPVERLFPMLRSSWTGVPVPQEIQPYILGKPNVIEDFGVLAGLTASTDAIWLSTTYAIRDEIAAGELVELRRARQHTEVVLYQLKRRSQSPLAKAMIGEIRQNIGLLQAEAQEQNKR
ncbi:MAG: LysR family transcriptional regulator [Novosphingobium sp.]|nr:LysR family transcriptional regulator [Novosphingobium sp.]